MCISAPGAIIQRMRSDYREEPCKAALNQVRGMGFGWSLNPYMGCAHRCAFCYVRAFERRADRPGDARYGNSIRVKINVAEVLRSDLARPSWRRELVAVGAATDPYQPAEGRYRLTRACLETLAEARTPFGIVTRGPLVVRDLDVLQHAARRAEVSVCLSIPTLDDAIWRRTEPGAPPPRQRLRALERLVTAGIRAGVAIAPILPGISDRPEQLEQVVRAARGAGATFVWGSLLHLKPGTREHFLDLVGREWPDRVRDYERLYGQRAYLQRRESETALARIRDLRVLHGIADRRPAPLTPPAQPKQLDLAL